VHQQITKNLDILQQLIKGDYKEMVIAYIEIERDKDWKGKGNINIIPKKEYWAILHGSNNEKIERTVFKVNTDQSNIDKVKLSHKDVKVYYTKKDMQLRGLEIRPGTPSDNEADYMISNLKTKYNIDLKTEINSTVSKSWDEHLKQDCDSIGENKWKCTNCNNINIQGIQLCTNCSMPFSDYGKIHVPSFNIDEWPL